MILAQGCPLWEEDKNHRIGCETKSREKKKILLERWHDERNNKVCVFSTKGFVKCSNKGEFVKF